MAKLKVSKERNKDIWFVSAYHSNGAPMFKNVTVTKNPIDGLYRIAGESETYSELDAALGEAKKQLRTII